MGDNSKFRLCCSTENNCCPADFCKIVQRGVKHTETFYRDGLDFIKDDDAVCKVVHSANRTCFTKEESVK